MSSNKINSFERKRNVRYKKNKLPFPQPVAVQIVKSSESEYWYKNQIGYVVKAMPMGDSYVVLPFDSEFMFLIDKKDGRQLCNLN